MYSPSPLTKRKSNAIPIRAPTDSITPKKVKPVIDINQKRPTRNFSGEEENRPLSEDIEPPLDLKKSNVVPKDQQFDLHAVSEDETFVPLPRSTLSAKSEDRHNSAANDAPRASWWIEQKDHEDMHWVEGKQRKASHAVDTFGRLSRPDSPVVVGEHQGTPDKVLREYEAANFAAQPTMKYADWKQRFDSEEADSAVGTSSSQVTASPAIARDTPAHSAPEPDSRALEEVDMNIFLEIQPISSEVGPAPSVAVSVQAKNLPASTTAYSILKLLGEQAVMVPDKAVEKQVKAFVDVATPGDQFLAMMQSGALSKVIRRRYGGPPAKTPTESMHDEHHTPEMAEEGPREAIAGEVDDDARSVTIPGTAVEAEATASDTNDEGSQTSEGYALPIPFGPGNTESFVLTDTLPFHAHHVYNALCASFGAGNFRLFGNKSNERGHYFVILTKMPRSRKDFGAVTCGMTTPFELPEAMKLELGILNGTPPAGSIGQGFQAPMHHVKWTASTRWCPLCKVRHDPRKCQTWVRIGCKEYNERKEAAMAKISAQKLAGANMADENGGDAGQDSVTQPLSHGAGNDPWAPRQPDQDDRDGRWTSYREVSWLDM